MTRDGNAATDGRIIVNDMVMKRSAWCAPGAARATAMILAALATGAASAQRYNAVDLGALQPRVTSAGFGLNNLGRVAGVSTTSSGQLRGLYWNGDRTELAPLAGDNLSHGYAINDTGQIAGVSFDFGELNGHGFVWSTGGVMELGDITPHDINDAGAVVGFVQVATANVASVSHAATWQSGVINDLGTLGGTFSYAAGISNAGQVVGWSATASDAQVRATLWQGGVPRDLGTLGGATSQACAISRENGYVAGYADTSAGEPHACVFRVSAAGAVLSRLDLGTLGGGSSYAYGINSQGVAVGASNGRAFRSAGGTIVDLNTLLSPDSGWVLESARDINELGQIVGQGVHNGLPRGFVLVLAGDLDADGQVTAADYVAFLACVNGPGVLTPPPGCSPYAFATADLDGDGDVDLSDVAVMQLLVFVP